MIFPCFDSIFIHQKMKMLFLINIYLLSVGLVSHAPSLLATSSPGSQRFVVKSCHNEECAALLAFKTTFPTDIGVSDCERPYAKTESWKNDNNSNCCRWDGVTCNPSSGHVTELDLSCSLLNGSFPSNSTLFRLRWLRHINLAYNNFQSSSIPSSFGQLSHLTYLNISNSGFSGQVPREIGWLFQLTTLDLSDLFNVEMSNFKTIIANLSNMRELHLSQVFINSDLPPMVANLSKLESLRLSHCGLQGEFPAVSVLNMPKLRVLDMGENYDIHHDFSTSTARWRSPMEVVDFYWCNFTGRLPDSIGESSNFSLRSFNISSCGFHGDIPSWMWNVKEVIRIPGNGFSGTLPSTVNMTTLAGLSTMDVSGNMITGMIPSWLFSLPALNSLLLSDNLLTGLSQSSANGSASSSLLAEFWARDNQLQGQIPEAIFQLLNLQSLDLQFNKLTGTVHLSKLHNLQKLNLFALSHNNLSIIDDMGADTFWPNLTNLGLSSCNLGHFPGFLRKQKNLEMLDLSNNGIHGLVPEWLLEIGTNSLDTLNLSHNSLTGGLEHLPWQNMNYIDISSNMLQGIVPFPPANTSFFRASNNQFTGEFPTSLCDISLQLLMLDLSHNNLTGNIPVCITNLITRGLSILDLRHNQLRDVVPSIIFENCQFLYTLSLSANLLQGPIPQSLSNCMRLQLFDVGNNKMNGAFPHWLDVLPNLEVLMLYSNNLQGPLKISNFTNPFPKLRILDISNNDLSGGLPGGLLSRLQAMIEVNATNPTEGTSYMEVMCYEDSIKAWAKGFNRQLDGILDILVFIDASRNRLEGPIPDAIGNLVSLRWLNLAHNNFTGSIPPSLGNLRLLESLDMSFNRLDGQIPSELVNLNSLEFFNVSENNLAGRVPTSKQFGTFLDDSYLGNPRLCGELLTKKCNKEGEPSNSRPVEGSGSELPGFHVWVIVLMGYGCGIFVGSVWGYYIFWERNHYQVGRLICKIEVFIMLYQRRRRQNRRN